MSVATKNEPPAKNEPLSRVFNIPNQLTTARLVLAIVLFVLMSYKLFAVSLVVFLIAAGTDWMDGYYARKYGQVTVLGRILDPFVDKIIICGTFIFLAAVPPEAGDPGGSQVRAWMAVVVVGRELLVTALRSFLEQQGADFSASWSGKLKMVLQCAAVALSLYHLTAPQVLPAWLGVALPTAVWASIVITVYSGIAYIVAAIRLLRPEAGG